MVNLTGKVAHTHAGEVEVGSLPDNSPFRISTQEVNARGRLEVTGWTYGVKLWSNTCRARVRLEGSQRHVVFGDGTEQRREFDAQGKSEVNYPTMVMVERVGPDDTNAALTHNWRSGGANQMADIQTDIPVTDPKVAAALIAKFDFQQKQLNAAIEAGNQAKIEMANARIAAIRVDANTKSVDLTPGDTKAMADIKAAAPKPKQGRAVPNRVTPDEMAQTKGAQLKAANAVRKASLAAKKEAAPAKPKPNNLAKLKAKQEARKANPELDATRDCLCGCGLETASLFRPGHDARVKGILLKVERGELQADDLPEALKATVKFAGRKATAGQADQDYRIVKAPVKFPGRPEIEVVKPE